MFEKAGGTGVGSVIKSLEHQSGYTSGIQKVSESKCVSRRHESKRCQTRRLQTNQNLRTGESGKESWWQNALKCVHILEDWAWSGRRAGTQRKAGQRGSSLESLTSPRTAYTSFLSLISQPCWVCTLICPRMSYIAENLWEVIEGIYQTPLSKPGSLDPGFLLSLSPYCSEHGWYVHHQQQEQGKEARN